MIKIDQDALRSLPQGLHAGITRRLFVYLNLVRKFKRKDFFNKNNLLSEKEC